MSDQSVTETGGPLYPIREVSRLTGVNSVTLRAWERRYGLIQPRRTPKGHRLYGRTDIERVERIVQWLNRGVPVSQVSDLLDKELPEDTAASEASPEAKHAEAPASLEQSGEWSEIANDIRALIERFDEQGLDQYYTTLLGRYPITTVLNNVLRPVVNQLENADSEHSASRLFLESFLRTRLSLRLYYTNLEISTPRLLLAPYPERGDNLSLLMLASALSAGGFHITLIDHHIDADAFLSLLQRCRTDIAVFAGAAHDGTASKDVADADAGIEQIMKNTHVPVCVYGSMASTDSKTLKAHGVQPLEIDLTRSVRLIRHLID
ncbi:MerR family transcriptional regulator [Larsenimonas suaedae]|uniref:MerR family transcriptional regulator n=1 Tax=Larsenimonas suaedae TaxID=1851019 RepID=A0ABU1GYR7_9GAMM|nr:MerR family transcriptional regulator [Larsenimonas suaedae]MCM2973675.1 MerR family transcriptional regulator [Larsenimonas suaedae]MDR5897191.1 MerR family transcriptional regulator [Larsenimonas suaedae]